MISLKLAFSSLRARLRLMSSAWLMATEHACEKCWSGVEAWSGSVLVVADVCSTCFCASTSEQLLSAWIWRAAFSVANLGQSLLEAECEPLQFRHLGLSEFGHVSLLWPGVAHGVPPLWLDRPWNCGRISDPTCDEPACHWACVARWLGFSSGWVGSSVSDFSFGVS